MIVKARLALTRAQGRRADCSNAPRCMSWSRTLVTRNGSNIHGTRRPVFHSSGAASEEPSHAIQTPRSQQFLCPHTNRMAPD